MPTRNTIVSPSVVKFWLNCSPVTTFRIQKALPTTSAFSCSLVNGVAPFFLRSAAVIPAGALFRASADGVYQIGELHARSCPVSGTTSGG